MTDYFRKAALGVVVGLGVIFLTSFVAGQIRGCWSPKPPKATPPVVDQGTPVPGPSSEAPTVTECVEIARPDLTREEVLAGMRKYGLNLPSKGQRSEQNAAKDERSTVSEPDGAPPEGDRPANRLVEPFALLAEEHFKHPFSGAELDVAAWFMGEGERVDLRAVWGPWTPPPVDGPAYFGNTAKFEKGFLLGYAGVKAGEETVADPGLGFHLRYRGWRIGKATIDAGALGLVTVEGDGAAMAGVGLSW